MDTTLPVFNAPTNRSSGPKYAPWDRRLAVRVLLAALVVGVLVDQALRTDVVGAAGTVTVVVAAVAMHVVRPWHRTRTAWLAMAIALAPWLSIRASHWLIAPTIIAIGVLFVLAANAGGGVPQTFPALGDGFAHVVAACIDAPRAAVRAAASATPADTTHQIRRSGTAIALSIMLGAVLLVLLASGDAFFAALLDTTAPVDHIVDVLAVIIAALCWLSLVLVGRRLRKDDTASDTSDAVDASSSSEHHTVVIPQRRVGDREVAWLLGTVAVVLGGYASSLALAALSGAKYVQRRTGLTYAEYARSGFFQLVAVVVIVSTVLIASRRIVARSLHRRRLLVVAVADAFFTLVMVIVSIARLQTYRDVFGLTMLRFSTTVFAVWLGAVVLLIVAALLHASWEPRLVAAVVLSAYATLVVTNVVNPEAIVVRENIGHVDWASGTTRSRGGAEFDSAYLGTQLSADAVPTLVAHLDDLPADQRAGLVRRLCKRRDRGDHGWSWNRSRADADDAIAGLCPG